MVVGSNNGNVLHVFASGHPVATCCKMLDGVGSSFKIVKFLLQHAHFWMLQDVACNLFGQLLHNMIQQCCKMLHLNVACVWLGLKEITGFRSGHRIVAVTTRWS